MISGIYILFIKIARECDKKYSFWIKNKKKTLDDYNDNNNGM